MANYLGLKLKPVVNISFAQRCKSHLHQAVKEAEKVVGYSTSFLNLRWLLNDEFANVALHIRKLIGTNHPLLHTARNLFMGNSLPNWGIIVLLISKATNINNTQNNAIDRDLTAGILNSQRVVAEVTEMIRTSYIIHKSIMNIRNSDVMADLNFGNKLALLSGDFLLGKCFKELAHLHNHDVSLIMSSTLRDLIESEFISSKPYKPVSTNCINVQSILASDPLNYNIFIGNPRAEWIYRSLLGGASLLAKACQCTLLLGKQSKSVQQLGYMFGGYIALAWQIQLEIDFFTSDTSNSIFSLTSAPVMLHLEKDPSLFDIIKSHQVDHAKVWERISLGNGFNASKLLQQELCSNALELLNELPNSNATNALENIVKSIIKL